MGNRAALRCFPRILVGAVAAFGCASNRPPADLAPDPALAARMQSIRIENPGAMCPGQYVRTSYTAVLTDGTEIPFAERYDRDDPPPLHVVMLDRASPHAEPVGRVDWRADPDPLLTVLDGFRLRVALRADSRVVGDTVIAPGYGCLPHRFAFSGQPGEVGRAGENGPDVTVRLAVLASPFYDRLLTALVEVGTAPPITVFADAAAVPPADWLAVTTSGGRGGRGTRGAPGRAGAAGVAGCPGAAGAPGGTGGNGGPGGAGGRGGRVIVVASGEDPFLAGLVEAESVGGRGGPGGAGGEGGAGGRGGPGRSATGQSCVSGAGGVNGSPGSNGEQGPAGEAVSNADFVVLPLEEVFGFTAPPTLRRLVDYARRSM